MRNEIVTKGRTVFFVTQHVQYARFQCNIAQKVGSTEKKSYK